MEIDCRFNEDPTMRGAFESTSINDCGGSWGTTIQSDFPRIQGDRGLMDTVKLPCKSDTN